MAQTLNYDLESVGGGGMGGFGNNPLLWLITLGFLKDGNGLGGNSDSGAGVLAGQTQAKLDCLQQGHTALSAQLANQTEANRFGLLNGQLNELQGISRDGTSELAGIQRDATAAIVNTINDLRAEQAKCCCETQLGIQKVDSSIQTQTTQLVAAGLANTQAILDKMCDTAQQALMTENDRLRSELNKSEILAAVNSRGHGHGDS